MITFHFLFSAGLTNNNPVKVTIDAPSLAKAARQFLVGYGDSIRGEVDVTFQSGGFQDARIYQDGPYWLMETEDSGSGKTSNYRTHRDSFKATA
jgi:hypothetical protein